MAAILSLDMQGKETASGIMDRWDKMVVGSPPIGILRWWWVALFLYTWPVTPRPTPPLSSETVPLLSVGNLYDAQTSYTWAQDVRDSFRAGSIITWQGYGHTF